MPKSRSTALFTFCICFTVLGLSQSTEWKEYVYAEDGFAISAPLAPFIHPDYLDGGKGEGLLGHSYFFPLTRQQQEASGYNFLLEVTLRRDGDQRTPEQVLNDAKNHYASYFGTSFKLASPARVIYEKPISLGKYPGIEFQMQHENIRCVGRFYVIDRRAYSLTVGTGLPFPDEMQRWYRSFRLIEATK
jgi:hypothetical protein